MGEYCQHCGIGPQIEGHHCEGTWKARAEKAEMERDEAKATLETTLTNDLKRIQELQSGLAASVERSDLVVSDNTNLRAALDEAKESANLCNISAVFHGEENTKLRAALAAADRLAEMVRQHAAQNAGYDASSDITTGDIGQEYEFYQAARAALGKAGGD